MQWKHQNSSVAQMHIGFHLTRVLSTCQPVLDDVAKAHVQNILQNISETVESCIKSDNKMDSGRAYNVINRHVSTIRSIFNISLEDIANQDRKTRGDILNEWQKNYRYSSAIAQSVRLYLGNRSIWTEYSTLFSIALETLDDVIWKVLQIT